MSLDSITGNSFGEASDGGTLLEGFGKPRRVMRNDTGKHLVG